MRTFLAILLITVFSGSQLFAAGLPKGSRIRATVTEWASRAWAVIPVIVLPQPHQTQHKIDPRCDQLTYQQRHETPGCVN
jgi:hypothetical protein